MPRIAEGEGFRHNHCNGSKRENFMCKHGTISMQVMALGATIVMTLPVWSAQPKATPSQAR
jgi:hypothetical protein